MKKFWIALIAITVAFMLAVPAMATNVTFSGTYRVRGHWTGDSDLSDEDSFSDATWNPRRNNDTAWYDMRFRMETVFEVSERLSINTRFDALDKAWGRPDDGFLVSDDNIDIDRIWMAIKSDWGMWDIGRMNTGVWATSWVDRAVDGDRIKYTLPIGNLALVGIIQKVSENDNTQGYEDADTDLYGIALNYSAENWSAGILNVYVRNRATGVTFGHAGPVAGQVEFDSDTYAFMPYFKGQFGPFGIQTELRYNTGFVDPNTQTTIINGFTVSDYDVEAWAFNLEGTYEMGPLTFQAGYAYLSGDDDLMDDDLDGYAAGSGDWEKSLILTGLGAQAINTWQQTRNTAATGGNLIGIDDGVYGVLSTATVGTASLDQNRFAADHRTPGAHMFYLGADYAATEALSFNFLYMYAMADDEFSGWDDDFGHEINIGLSYDIYENLTYSASFGYLFTGDFWEGGNAIDDAAEGLAPGVNGVGSGNEEDMWILTHELVLSF